MSIESEVFNIQLILSDNADAFSRRMAAATVATNALGKSVNYLDKKSASNLFTGLMNNLGSAGFKSSLVSASQGFMTFGRNLEKGTASVQSMKSALKEYRADVTRTQSSIARLGREHVRMSQSIAYKAGTNPDGSLQARVIQPNVADMKGQLKENGKMIAANAAAQDQMNRAQEVARHRINQDIVNKGKNMQWQGRQLMVGLTLPIVAFGYLSVKAFKEVDEALVRLTKVYGDAAKGAGTLAEKNEQVRKMGKEMADELADKYGQGGAESIGMMADFAATGKTDEDLKVATREGTRLSVLGDVDKDQSIQTILTLTNAFKVSNEDLAESINFLNAVENQTSLSLQDMTVAMPLAATAVKALGGDVKDLALFMTAMKEGGIDANEGANALKSSLARIVAPKPRAVKGLAAFGIDLNKIVSDNRGDITKTILALKAEIDKNVPQADKVTVFEKMFGLHHYTKMLAMFENINGELSQTKQVMELAGLSAIQLGAIAENEVGTKMESASAKFKVMVEKIKLEFANFGEPVMNALTVIGTGVSKLLEGFNGLPEGLKSVFGWLIAIGGVIVPIGVMMSGIILNFIGTLKNYFLGIATLIQRGRGMTKNFSMITDEQIANRDLSKAIELATEKTELNIKGMEAAWKKVNVELAIAEKMNQKINKWSYMDQASRDVHYKRMMNPDITGNKGEYIDSDRRIERHSAVTSQAFQRQSAIALGGQRTSSRHLPLFGNVNAESGKKLDELAKQQVKQTTKNNTITGMLNGTMGKVDIAKKQEVVATKTHTTALERAAVALKRSELTETQRQRLAVGGKIGRFGGGGGLAMGAMMAGSMMPEDALGGYGGLASSIGMGAGVGMMFGPYGAAIGAAGGALKGFIDLNEKANTKAQNAFKASGWAVEKFGAKVVKISDINMESFLNKSKGAVTEAKALMDAIKGQEEGGVEKSLVDNLKGTDDLNEILGFSEDYFKAQSLAGVPVEDIRKTIAAAVSLAGKDIALTEINVKLKSLKINNAKDAMRNAIKGMEKTVGRPELKLDPLAAQQGQLPTTQVQRLTSQSIRELAEVYIAMPTAMVYDDFNNITKALQEQGIAANQLSEEDLVALSNEMMSLEGDYKLLAQQQQKIFDDEDSNFTRGESWLIASAKIARVIFDVDRLKSMAGNTAEVMKYLNEQIANKKAADEFEKSFNKIASSVTKVAKAGGGVITQEQAAKNADSIGKMAEAAKEQSDAAAEAAKEASDKRIKAMEDAYSAQEEKMAKNIELVKKRYDDEIKKIEEAEKVRQKAFDAEQKRIQRSNELRNMEIDYLKAVNTGGYFDAMKIRSDIGAKKSGYKLADQNEGAVSKTDAKKEAIANKRDKITQQMDARLEATKKANAAAIEGAKARAEAEQKSFAAQSEAAQKAFKVQEEAARNAYKGINNSSKAAADSTAKLTADLTSVWRSNLQKFNGDYAKALAATAFYAEKKGAHISTVLAMGISAGAKQGIHLTMKQLREQIDIVKVEALAATRNAAGVPYFLQRRAFGGIISGPGTDRSDSIPILASNNEYVIQASSVRKYGKPLFDLLNAGRFATGGLIAPKMNMGGSVSYGQAYSAGGMISSKNNNPAKNNREAGGTTNINVMFGRTSASTRDIEKVLTRVLDKNNAKMGTR